MAVISRFIGFFAGCSNNFKFLIDNSTSSSSSNFASQADNADEPSSGSSSCFSGTRLFTDERVEKAGGSDREGGGSFCSVEVSRL